jgi:DNA polymerase-1
MIPCEPEAYNLMHEGAIVMSEISSNGFRIDTEFLSNSRLKMQEEIKNVTKELKEHDYWRLWKKRYGEKAKLTSPDQLGKLLFKELKYQPTAYTDKGKPSTDALALEKIDDPFVRDYSRMCKLIKSDRTFLAGIERETRGGFLRVFFNLHTTKTWRSSSEAVNFQNLPIREGEMARLIRSCFIPRKGRCIAEIDCSGVEVRISACYHKDPAMIRYIEDPSTDMHRDTACDIFLCKPEQVTKAARTASKNSFVFPEFYGSYYKTVGSDLWDVMEMRNITLNINGKERSIRKHLAKKGITERGTSTEPEPGTFMDHIRTVEKIFWKERFRGYDKWKFDTFAQYLKTGGWKTKTGFQVTGIYSKNDVTNHPIQGSAFHCLLWGLIRLQKWLRKHKMKTLIIGQIHDSVVLDAVPSELQDVLHKWKYIMEVELPRHWKWIIVPMVVEADVAPIDASWFAKEPYDINSKGIWVPKTAL